MAFTAAAVSTLPVPAHSIGPVKVEYQTWSCASGDTSGTITASRLQTVLHVEVSGGIQLSAQPTISGTTVTLAFANPLATVAGQARLYGR